eukprot:CAMPEP_0204323858 /NCGR_PEP_ID=MMETSP0469-20131031/9758_1 /ASSEMBLY_ACC=CAM_ASM_000384 /TAXON_ID=2969 /ORGANISM="Oxyrrhis marina" /LENGTH=185 /DNA_ID=CAMNT_0051305407 /DNA_START=35 /DNA_END=589 /DNA_ORIENTATION=-
MADAGGTLTFSQRLRLARGAAGVYLFFISYGRLQERVFGFRGAGEKRFHYIWFFQMVDALGNALVGLAGRTAVGATAGRGVPHQLLALNGISQVASKWCFNKALSAGLSFYIATMAKSMKLVPVMVGSLLAGRAAFTARQVAQAACIAGGTTMVSLAEGSSKSGASTAKGLVLILVALAGDGVTG